MTWIKEDESVPELSSMIAPNVACSISDIHDQCKLILSNRWIPMVLRSKCGTQTLSLPPPTPTLPQLTRCDFWYWVFISFLLQHRHSKNILSSGKWWKWLRMDIHKGFQSIVCPHPGLQYMIPQLHRFLWSPGQTSIKCLLTRFNKFFTNDTYGWLTHPPRHSILMKKDCPHWPPSTKNAFSRASFHCTNWYSYNIFTLVAELRKGTGGDLLRTGTLYEMLEATRDNQHRRVLNGLDFKMGQLSSLIPPPRFRQVSFVEFHSTILWP